MYRFIEWLCGKLTGHRGELRNVQKSPNTAYTHFGERYCHLCGKVLNDDERLYIDAIKDPTPTDPRLYDEDGNWIGAVVQKEMTREEFAKRYPNSRLEWTE